jgi:hypothetical protein
VRRTVRQIRADAEALAKTLGALPLGRLEGPASDRVGRHYNRLRQAAVQLKPDLIASMPPAFAAQPVAKGTTTHPTCLDVMVSCGQLFALLSPSPKRPRKAPVKTVVAAKPRKG